MVSKKFLVGVSLLADALDLLVIGQMPGLSWVIDLPVTALHVAFAGPTGLLTLFELIPLVGTVPIYTAAALAYSDHGPEGLTGTSSEANR